MRVNIFLPPNLHPGSSADSSYKWPLARAGVTRANLYNGVLIPFALDKGTIL
jgi:hypothetical protein